MKESCKNNGRLGEEWVIGGDEWKLNDKNWKKENKKRVIQWGMINSLGIKVQPSGKGKFSRFGDRATKK